MKTTTNKSLTETIAHYLWQKEGRLNGDDLLIPAHYLLGTAGNYHPIPRREIHWLTAEWMIEHRQYLDGQDWSFYGQAEMEQEAEERYKQLLKLLGEGQ